MESPPSTSRVIPIEPLFPVPNNHIATNASSTILSHKARLTLVPPESPSTSGDRGSSASPGGKSHSSPKFDDPLLQWREAKSRPESLLDMPHSPSQPAVSIVSPRVSRNEDSPGARRVPIRDMFSTKWMQDMKRSTSGVTDPGLSEMPARSHSYHLGGSLPSHGEGWGSRIRHHDSSGAAAAEDELEAPTHRSFSRRHATGLLSPGAGAGKGLQSKTHDALTELLGSSPSIKIRDSTGARGSRSHSGNFPKIGAFPASPRASQPGFPSSSHRLSLGDGLGRTTLPANHLGSSSKEAGEHDDGRDPFVTEMMASLVLDAPEI